MKEGFEIGKKEEFEIGNEIGEKMAQKQIRETLLGIAKDLHNKGLPIPIFFFALGLSLEDIETFKKEAEKDQLCNALILVVKNMHKQNQTIDDIALATGLSRDVIEELIKRRV